MSDPIDALRGIVQTNCHVVDARHAADYTLCIYLLKMRELFRWEHGYRLRDPLPAGKLGDWISAREQVWDGLQDATLQPLPIHGSDYDPFDSDDINAQLLPHGYLYSGGYGLGYRPHFVLAELIRNERQDNFQILIAGRELARDLTAPPGATLDHTILIRTESLRRWIWERVQEWQWQRLNNPLGRALAHYDFEQDPDSALEAMAKQETETVLWHELGEVLASQYLGSEWADMLSDLPRSPAELVARAVRDHLADCLSTLPNLIDHGETASLHFYFGNLSGIRKQLFPLLLSAYENWCDSRQTAALTQAVRTGAKHWRSVGEEILDLHQRYGLDGIARIGDLGQARAL